MNAVFINRRDAGQKLAIQLLDYANQPQAIVLGLPRGGMSVAYEIATKLNLPLDVCLVRKLVFPDNPDLAVGAVAENSLIHDYDGNITILDQEQVLISELDLQELQAIAAQEKAELRWRESCYRHYRPMLTVGNRIVIIVDDGMTTGLTMYATIEALKQHQPTEIIVATPVAAPQAIAKVEHLVDNFTCLVMPYSLGAVGFWYEDFSQITDQEVCALLSRQTRQNFAESR